MKDVLNREIKVGSVVVVKATSKYSSGLKLGAVISIDEETGPQVLIAGPEARKQDHTIPLKYSEYYLIENPTESEKQLCEKVFDEWLYKQLLVPLKLSELEHLCCYKNKQNDEFTFFKNISFDLVCEYDNSISKNFQFKNHFIQIYNSPAYSDVFKKRKTIPKLYKRIRKYTEYEIVQWLTKQKEKTIIDNVNHWEYCDKRQIIYLDSKEIEKYFEISIKDQEKMYDEYSKSISLKDINYYDHLIRKQSVYWTSQINYEFIFHVSNIKIWE